jgi:hypothetical protein
MPWQAAQGADLAAPASAVPGLALASAAAVATAG